MWPRLYISSWNDNANANWPRDAPGSHVTKACHLFYQKLLFAEGETKRAGGEVKDTYIEVKVCFSLKYTVAVLSSFKRLKQRLNVTAIGFIMCYLHFFVMLNY